MTFTTIFPGCYAGRFPHIHFEAYPTITDATLYSNSSLISQIALPADISNDVYALSTYGNSARNLGNTSINSDNVFSDNTSEEIASQTASVTGSNATSYVGNVTIGLAV